MGLIAAKCTQCGANIKVDDTKEAGICEFCGTEFITEKVINHYEIVMPNPVSKFALGIVKEKIGVLNHVLVEGFWFYNRFASLYRGHKRRAALALLKH